MCLYTSNAIICRQVNDKQVIDADTGKAAVLRHATPDVLVVVGPDMKTVNLVGKPVTVVGGSVLIAPGKLLRHKINRK